MKLQVQAPDGLVLTGEAQGPPDAPTVLLLNSIGCDRRQWDAQVATLATCFRCLTFDARGHGESQASAGDYTIGQLGRDALAVLNAAGAQTAHVCGLSLGGLVAQWLAIHATDRTATLTLANTASRIGTSETWEARGRLVLDQGLGAIADMAMERFFSAAFRDTHPQVVAAQRARLLAVSEVGYAGCCAALREADFTSQLGRITAPTLVIAGERDVSTTVEQVAALAYAIPAARLKILPAGHLSNLEQSEAFTAALRAHLETA